VVYADVLGGREGEPFVRSTRINEQAGTSYLTLVREQREWIITWATLE
jgi:hypothetical protein